MENLCVYALGTKAARTKAVDGSRSVGPSDVPVDDAVTWGKLENGLRYAIKDDGTSATLDEFIELYDAHVQTEEQIIALQNTKPKEQVAIKDGPPCLQILCKEQISEGGRNNGLFNIGVYLRKSSPDDWQDKILEHNMKYLNPQNFLPSIFVVSVNQM